MKPIHLNPQQQNIVDQAVNWFRNSSEQVFQYSGSAGTGKSVVMNAIIQTLGLDITEVAPMSFIGAAVIVMRQKGLINAKTVHSWLYELKWEESGEVDGYLNRPKKRMVFVPKPLPPEKKLICIDEAGCVPYHLKAEIENRGIKVLACGDLNQLPPVKDKPAYLYNGDVKYLTQIMRQNEGSGIVYLAQQILEGKPLQEGFYGNAVVMPDTLIRDSIIEQSEAIVCGRNATREKFNRYVRKNIMGFENSLPNYGEKLVCRKNNWSQEVDGINLANGLVGYVSNQPDPSAFDGKTFSMNFLPPMLTHSFVNLKCDYKYFVASPEERQAIKSSPYFKGEKFEYAYAVTTHLSQGAQYRTGIYFKEYLNQSINKNLDYTGITRFSNGCFVFIPTKRFY